MVQLSEPTIIVAIITVIGAITVAIIGASKYGKRKAETNLFSEFRQSATLMQESYKETIADLRTDKEIIRGERDALQQEHIVLKQELATTRKERDKALEQLEQFQKDFDKMKDEIQSNTTEIALIKDMFCLNAKSCKNNLKK